jgi:hypothetical protein
MPFMYMYLKHGFIELSGFHKFILRNDTRVVEEKTPFFSRSKALCGRPVQTDK